MNKVVSDFIKKEIAKFDFLENQWMDEQSIIKEISKKFSNKELYDDMSLRFKVKGNYVIAYNSSKTFIVCSISGETFEEIKETFVHYAGNYLWNVINDDQNIPRVEIYLDELHEYTGLLNYIFDLLYSSVSVVTGKQIRR